MAATLNFDAKDMLAKVSVQLREQQEKAGLAGAASAVQGVEAAREAATKCTGAVLEKARDDVKGVLDAIDEALANPASLMPGGGLLAMCTGMLAAQVVSVLKDVKKDGESLQTAFTKLATSAPATVNKLGGVLVKVTEGVTSSVEKLKAMPDQFKGMSEKVKEPHDFIGLDLDSIKKLLDPSIWGTPLNELGGLKTELNTVVPELTGAINRLLTFAKEAPAKIESAAQPCGCSSGPLPGPLGAVQQKLAALKALDLSPLQVGMTKVQEVFSKLEVDSIKTPLDTFAKAAMDLIHPVAEAQDKLKKAQGLAGATSAVTNALGGLKKLF